MFHVEQESTPIILWMSRGKYYILYFTPIPRRIKGVTRPFVLPVLHFIPAPPASSTPVLGAAKCMSVNCEEKKDEISPSRLRVPKPRCPNT